tara:strand:+ start:838 stop:1023 length:186 start_codon:yes stop_codon:yes gene_type:complete
MVPINNPLANVAIYRQTYRLANVCRLANVRVVTKMVTSWPHCYIWLKNLNIKQLGILVKID